MDEEKGSWYLLVPVILISYPFSGIKAHLKIGKVVNCQNILKDFNTKYKTEKKGVFRQFDVPPLHVGWD
jgi:hypothetical protein